jgi:hypothetical protein
MFLDNKIHFEISERKMILRVFDVFFCFCFLILIGNYFDVDYLVRVTNTWYWMLFLGVYLNLFELFSKCIIFKLPAISFKYSGV